MVVCLEWPIKISDNNVNCNSNDNDYNYNFKCCIKKKRWVIGKNAWLNIVEQKQAT